MTPEQGLAMMPRLANQAILFVTLLALLGGCERSPEELVGAMILAENIEEFVFRAEEASALGDKAIPIYVAVLNRHVEVPGSLLEMDKSYWCVFHLHKLARDGIYSIDEVPVLLRHMQKWRFLKSTRLAAETLQIITGLDVGYDEQFIGHYTDADEPERLRMLAMWRDWYNKKVGIVE
jgi:hypothetical protein